jgi:hypothetical protein
LAVIHLHPQALVEMAELTSSHAAVTFYSQRSPVLRGHVVTVQFTNLDQISPDDPLLQVHGSRN